MCGEVASRWRNVQGRLVLSRRRRSPCSPMETNRHRPLCASYIAGRKNGRATIRSTAGKAQLTLSQPPQTRPSCLTIYLLVSTGPPQTGLHSSLYRHVRHSRAHGRRERGGGNSELGIRGGYSRLAARARASRNYVGGVFERPLLGRRQRESPRRTTKILVDC